ncbi:hypothetical protein ABZ078_11080 [Streptomyces sp. NPDC006385]|uniref:hypothetical protein n=1 Tax=Streptomyces sp. NPDC006385 TaxID=3156761 RepID=UPI0033B2916C
MMDVVVVVGMLAAGVMAVLRGAVALLNYVLDQIPALSAKAERVITVLRRLRNVWRDDERAPR